MGGWTRNRLPLIGGAVLMIGAGVWVGWAYLLEPTQRGDALALPGFVLGLAGVLVGIAPMLLAWGRRPPARPVDDLAALLAEAVDSQWRKEAHERRLPDPIPIRWALSDLAVAGPVTAAVGTPEAPPAFPPLPGHARIAEADLRTGGGRGELHAVYSGLASGRMVVVGAPGAGKSGTAILLLLDALAHRGTLDEAQRTRVPVPVLLTAQGWDPNTRSVRAWLAERLTATYPMFAHRGGLAEAAALVAARDKVALILDGLDEMDAGLRPAALRALSDAPFRVVVLTRSQEMSDAAASAWLFGAVAMHLHDVTAADAADYLTRARTGPPPAGWAELLAHLRGHPAGVLARALSTPLALTLLRDTYQPGDNAAELLDTTRFGSPEHIRQHLIARVLPAAYSPQPGRPAPRYTERQARQALSCLAHRMGTDRDLAWWRIPLWAPAIPRSLVTGLWVGLLVGLAAALMGVLDASIVYGIGVGTGLGLAAGRGGNAPQRVRMANLRTVVSRPVLGRAFPGGPLAGLVFGFIVSAAAGLPEGLVAGAVGGFVFGFGLMLIEGGTDESSPLGPRDIWRNDQKVGLVFGLVFGLLVGLGTGFASGLAVGFAVGLAVAVAGVLVYPETWPTTLAWRQLQLSGQVPVIRLMPFLEDARERGVLRTVGAVYQFRHATLQEQLARQAVSDSAEPSAVPRVS